MAFKGKKGAESYFRTKCPSGDTCDRMKLAYYEVEIFQQRYGKVLFALGFIGIVLVTKANAQTNEQIWFEYMLNYPFANSWNLENAVTASTTTSSPKWRAYDYSATLERDITQHFQIVAQGVLSYTNQTDGYNTMEIRPVLGTRFYLTPSSRIQTKLLFRLEQRNIQDLDTKLWSQTWRPRARAEIIVPINQDSYYKDNLWYALADVEWLFSNTDTDLKERFANRFRLRTGVGYRLSYSLRFEFIYMYQASRNGIDEAFTSSDNIFRVRIKHYLRKTKPSNSAGGTN